MEQENPIPEPDLTAGVTGARQAPREPVFMLVLGIILTLCMLGLAWWRSGERSEGVPVMEAVQARGNTRIVELMLYAELGGHDTLPSQAFSGKMASQAASTARLWRAVGKASTDKHYRALTEVNAASLYGTANNFAAARHALARAAKDDPRHADTYRALRSLYADTATAITFSPSATRLLGTISAGPLMQARNYQLADNTRAAVRVLRHGAQAGTRTLLVLGGMRILGVIIVLTTIIVLLARGRRVFTALHEVQQSPPARVPWGIGTALTVLGMHFFVTVALSLLFTLALPFLHITMSNAASILLSIVATLISAILVLGGFLLMLGYHPWEWHVFGWQPTKRGAWHGLLTLLLILPLFWLVSVISGIIFDGDKGTNPLIPSLLGSSPWLQLVLVLAAVVMAPLVEETLFRGIFFRALGERLPFWGAAAISGFVFALAHGQLAAILPIGLLGITFAFLTRRTGSLWASAAAHGVYNGIITCLLMSLSWALR